MKKTTLALTITALLFASTSTSLVADTFCYQTPEGDWVCIQEPIMQPMGPGSGGTGGDDKEDKKVKG